VAYFQDEFNKTVSFKVEATQVERLHELAKKHNESVSEVYRRALTDFTGAGDFTNAELEQIMLALHLRIEQLESTSRKDDVKHLEALLNKVSNLEFQGYPKFNA
jgi:pimeloyl-CoA synthetase